MKGFRLSPLLDARFREAARTLYLHSFVSISVRVFTHGRELNRVFSFYLGQNGSSYNRPEEGKLPE